MEAMAAALEQRLTSVRTEQATADSERESLLQEQQQAEAEWKAQETRRGEMLQEQAELKQALAHAQEDSRRRQNARE